MMTKRRSRADSAILERYRVALENVEAQSEIAAIMAEFGYDSAMIEEGKQLFTKTREAYDVNLKEDDETSQAYSDFAKKRELLDETYTLHRKKAKVVFRKNLEIMKRLELDEAMPRVYVKWLEAIKKFYAEMGSDTSLQQKMARLKVTAEELNAAETLVNDLEAARSLYLREKGESQDATAEKDTAFSELEDWMSEFYAVARIALEDNIQLLEALGVIVRN
jgi:hypothetical protein